MTPEPTEDHQLRDVFGALDPGKARLARLEERILADLATDRKSLAAEWLNLFRLGPVLNAGYVVTAAAGLAVVTPVGSMLLAALLL